MTYEKMYEQWLSNLNKEINKRKLNLEKLADLSNMEKQNLCCILTGSRKASAKKLFSIANNASIHPRAIFNIN